MCLHVRACVRACVCVFACAAAVAVRVDAAATAAVEAGAGDWVQEGDTRASWWYWTCAGTTFIKQHHIMYLYRIVWLPTQQHTRNARAWDPHEC